MTEGISGSADDAGWGTRAAVVQQIKELARPYLQTRNNEIHTRISEQFARRLLELGGDPSVVIPAILLHDVGWSQVPEDLHIQAMGTHPAQPEQRDLHEREGARIAGEILAAVGCPEEVRSKITAIIAGHDSKLQADSLEEAIVKDADALYRFTREAVLWFESNDHLDARSYLARIERNLERWFHTDLGRQLARAGLAVLRAEWPVLQAPAGAGLAARMHGTPPGG